MKEKSLSDWYQYFLNFKNKLLVSTISVVYGSDIKFYVLWMKKFTDGTHPLIWLVFTRKYSYTNNNVYQNIWKNGLQNKWITLLSVILLLWQFFKITAVISNTLIITKRMKVMEQSYVKKEITCLISFGISKLELVYALKYLLLVNVYHF